MEAISPIAGKPVTRVATLEFVKVTRGGVPDSQFTLQAFDIPGVSSPLPRRYFPLDRWYFWSLIAIAVAAWIYSRRRPKVGVDPC
jgi:hypothetical protein